MPFSPFKNESDALTISNLNIENRTDRVQIYGTLVLGRDREGLAAAKALRDVLVDIVKELEGEPGLPYDVAAAEPSITVEPVRLSFESYMHARVAALFYVRIGFVKLGPAGKRDKVLDSPFP